MGPYVSRHKRDLYVLQLKKFDVMKDRLPPLTGLRAFDAAARHMSFAKAAEELHVTPAALSYQIKSLEQHLGAPVFVRLNRAVELTDVGRSLAAGTQESFAGLHRAWRRARASLDDNLLIVTAGPAFTAKWLAPRMFGFAQAHPEIDLRFSATLKLMDFDRDDVDIAIRFGVPREEEALFSEPLLREWVTPMMHPDLADRYATPESLLEAPLIHQPGRAFQPGRPCPGRRRGGGGRGYGALLPGGGRDQKRPPGGALRSGSDHGCAIQADWPARGARQTTGKGVCRLDPSRGQAVRRVPPWQANDAIRLGPARRRDCVPAPPELGLETVDLLLEAEFFFLEALDFHVVGAQAALLLFYFK